ncbi:hypothetical protein P3X46_026029 [Hevea brasiliensis]|uniref:Bet v I/Major latex protein domain-containing protein n=1 Tax=Hevea brasiliensis TaxID=3981 RepID=A0ABQ9KWR9_HEVBR|nr:hypothetical protein P3X46_026029 [Hevea brasiliensis]
MEACVDKSEGQQLETFNHLRRNGDFVHQEVKVKTEQLSEISCSYALKTY